MTAAPVGPRRTFTDIRFAAALLFAGAALFAAIDLAPAPTTANHPPRSTGTTVGPASPAGPSTTTPSRPEPVIAATRGEPAARGTARNGLLGVALGGTRSGSGGGSSAPVSGAPAKGGTGSAPPTTVTPSPSPTTTPSLGTIYGAPTSSPTTVPTTPVPTTTVPPPPPPTAYGELSSVRSDLQGLATTSMGTAAPRITDAINKLGAALSPAAWPAGSDGDSIASGAGSVFDNTKAAVNDLVAVAQAPVAWQLPRLVDTLVAATRLLAASALAANSCLASKPSALTQASQQIAAGDAAWAGGQPAKAVDAYKAAWAAALSAHGSTC